MQVRGKLWRALPCALGACAAIACALMLAPRAWANVYCVNEPACVSGGGTEEGTNGNAIQKALEAAEKHANTGAADEVVIGAGVYTRATEGYSYGGSEAVAIHGAGVRSTTLSVAGKHTTMNLTSIASTTLERPDGGSTGGRRRDGAVDERGDGPRRADRGPERGHVKHGPGSQRRRVHDGLDRDVEGRHELHDGRERIGRRHPNTSLEGGEYGIQASGFPLIRGCRIAATQYGLLSYSSGRTAEDTLIDLGGKPSYGIYLDANSANAVGNFRQMTIVNGDTSAIGILASAEAKHTASVTLENSIVAAIGRPLSVTTDSKAGTSSTVTTRHTSYEVERAVKSGTGATITDEDVHVIPGEFANPVTGGDWRLLATSPLLGLGSPKTLQAGEYEFDAAGNPRIVNGQRDLGAYENQRRPPLANAAASASSVQVGAAVTFDGAGSSVQEPGDSIASYEWTFDDGGAANGAQVTHAFATPGLHVATLTVADLMGIPLTAQASVSVNVSSPPAVGPGDRGPGPTTIAPRLVADSGLRAVKVTPSAFRARRAGPSVLKGERGGALVSYTLSETAVVTFKVQRLLPGVKRGKACVRGKAGTQGGRRCMRRLPMRGSFTSLGRTGVNSLRFSGRLEGKRLSRGSYLLLASASGRAARAPFQIRG